MTTIVVTAAVVEREGHFLVTRRLKGTHLAGTWEFPGGKCDPGESLHECMQRELLEELAVRCRVGDEVFTISHQYDDRIVELHFFACTLLDEPRPQLGQQMQWIPRAQLRTLDFPPADAELIEKLSLET
ncbi:MAG: (deoxy)nucleoside triphosphate pyrophosphohydrolase [Vicinamibacterales bacterium]